MALINRNSVNLTKQTDFSFPFPYFIFTEKIRTKVVVCKQLTMISPLFLMVGGCRQICFDVKSNSVVLDGWLKIVMDPTAAATVTAMRALVDHLMVTYTTKPFDLAKNDGYGNVNEQIVRLLLKDLSRLDGSFHAVVSHEPDRKAETKRPRNSGGRYFNHEPGTEPSPKWNDQKPSLENLQLNSTGIQFGNRPQSTRFPPPPNLPFSYS